MSAPSFPGHVLVWPQLSRLLGFGLVVTTTYASSVSFGSLLRSGYWDHKSVQGSKTPSEPQSTSQR